MKHTINMVCRKIDDRTTFGFFVSYHVAGMLEIYWKTVEPGKKYGMTESEDDTD